MKIINDKYIHLKLKKIATTTLRFAFDGIIYIKRSVHFIINKILIKPIAVLGKKTFYLTLVPAYKFYLKTKNKLTELLGLDKETNLYLLTHRRATHIIIVVLTFLTILTNLQVGETRAETQFGQDIILAALIETQELGMLIEEGATQALPQTTNYFEDEDFTVEKTLGIENIDAQRLAQEGVITTTQDEATLIKPQIPTSKAIIDLQNRQNTIDYIVKEGDNIGKIAQQFGLYNSTILWANNLSAYSIIQPDQKLIIPPADGITHTVKKNETLIAIAKKYSSDLDKIINFNNLIDADDIGINQKLFIPDGKKQRIYTPRASRSRLANLIIPSSAPIVSKTRMLWPTSARRITQYYSWRHRAIDIASKAPNVPIYASDDGTVSVSDGKGWNGGYGVYVIIDHGNGKTTLYSHNKKNLVSAGEKVTKGQVIAIIGNTGRSSGPHVHFEVRFGGTKVNPLKYVK